MHFSPEKNLIALVALLTTLFPARVSGDVGEPAPPLGRPGMQATYRLEPGASFRSNSVERFTLSLGPVEQSSGRRCQWLALSARKVNGQGFAVWILSRAFPPPTIEQATTTTIRYLLQEGD